MTKHEIAKKILDLMNYDKRTSTVAIIQLASEVEKDAQVDDFCDKDWSGLQGGV